jgi:hypothetical protein
VNELTYVAIYFTTISEGAAPASVSEVVGLVPESHPTFVCGNQIFRDSNLTYFLVKGRCDDKDDFIGMREQSHE